jgi:hypothetical protein
MPWLRAFGKIQYRVHSAGRDIPPPLKAGLKRTGKLISPNELARQILGWKRCADCRDEGTLGNAIDRDLRFCGCPAGVEGAYSKGTDWPAQKIACVHASAKSLLVAACHAAERAFTADAVSEADVSDLGDTLEIRLQGVYAEWGIPEADMRQALERPGWRRRNVIHGSKPKPAPQRAGPPAPARPPITQADVERELAKRRQKIPPQKQAGCDLATRVAAGGVQ